jgi:hypothetical protein
MTAMNIRSSLHPSLHLLGRVGRTLRREPQIVWLALRMGSWVIVLSLLARVCALSRVLELIALRHAVAGKRPLSPMQLAQLLDRMLRRNWWVFTPTCWKRAIILQRYLALNGIATHIVFGVRRAGERALDGHSWLEVDGQPFLEAQPPDYLVTYSFPR